MAKKILVVDDDLYIRELYVEILKDEQYDVDSAVNGEDAISKLSNGGYDLILLDIMMPKMDGLGVMDTLNKMTVKNGPVILLTNLDHDPLIKEAMGKGAAAFIIKADITPPDLLTQIKKYLSETS